MNTEALTRLITILHNDNSALGWDLPAKIYTVTGALEDPRFDLLAQNAAKPHETLLEMYEAGMRPGPSALGLATYHEGWRMRMPGELTEEQMPQLAVLRASGRTRGLSEVEIETGLAMFFMDLAREFGIAGAPDFLKVEVRNVLVVMRDGTVVSGIQDRDGDLQVMLSTVPGSEVFDPANCYGGNVTESMHAVLFGRRPDF